MPAKTIAAMGKEVAAELSALAEALKARRTPGPHGVLSDLTIARNAIRAARAKLEKTR